MPIVGITPLKNPIKLADNLEQNFGMCKESWNGMPSSTQPNPITRMSLNMEPGSTEKLKKTAQVNFD